MPVNPEWIVAPPKSIPPLHSLLASSPELQFLGEDVAVNHVDGAPTPRRDNRWEGGLVFQPELCQEPSAWAPCRRTNEVQSITVDAAAGTWTAQFGVDVTGPLPFNVTAFALQTALWALPSIGAGNVLVTGGPGDVGGTTPYLIEFVGVFTEVNVGALIVASIDLAGGAGTVVQATTQQAGELIQKSDYVPTDAIFYEPPVLEVPFTCTTYSRMTWDEYRRLALENLELGESKALEAEFWSGAKNPSNPSLVHSTPNDDAHILNPGGAAAPVAVNPTFALMLLAQALANCGTGAQGMIHATAALAERWSGQYEISPTGQAVDNKVLITRGRGDIIVDGAGYPGTGPFGQPPPAPNEAWAYATGIVNVRLGEPQLYPETLAEALDRATNTVTVRAEVSAAAVWNLCCTFAVLVDLCGT